MEDLGLLQFDWLSLLEVIGDVVSPVIALVAVREARKVAKASNNYIRAQQHGNYWLGLIEKPEFATILDPQRNITANPVTVREEVLVGLVFLHFQSDYIAAKHKLSNLPATIQDDIRAYFKFPVVIDVWKKRRPFLEPEFVSFVEAAFRATMFEPSIELRKAA